MPERRGRERIFEIDPVKRPKGLWLRRLIANYVVWVEVFGYLFCAAVATGIIVCWVYKVDEIAREKDVGKSLIKPREETLTHTKDAVVTRLAVKEWGQVAHWAFVVEICDDPEWVARYRTIEKFDEFAKGLRELEKTAPLPADVLRQVMAAEKEVETWNRGPAREKSRTMLQAPTEGVVIGTSDLAGKFIKSGDPICKIVNFSDLHISVKLSGVNVERVRVGMPAKITVSPDYGLGCVVRADARLGWFSSERLQFNYALDGKETKALLLNWWKEHPVVSQEDVKRKVALTPSEVEEAEITCALTVEPFPPAEADQLGETSLLKLEEIGRKNPLRGTLVSGKHTGTYTTNHLSPDVREQLTQKIGDVLKGKVARFSGDLHHAPLRVEGVYNVRNYLKLKASITDLTMDEPPKPQAPDGKKTDKEQTQQEIQAAVVDGKATADAGWKLRRAGMDQELAQAAQAGVDVDKGDRFFEGEVRLSNPPVVLSEKVREAYEKSPTAYLKAKTEVVVGRCRLAMLLFRQ